MDIRINIEIDDKIFQEIITEKIKSALSQVNIDSIVNKACNTTIEEMTNDGIFWGCLEEPLSNLIKEKILSKLNTDT